MFFDGSFGVQRPSLSTDSEWSLTGVQLIAVIHAGRAMAPFFQEGPGSLAVSPVWRLFLANTEVGKNVGVGGVRGT